MLSLVLLVVLVYGSSPFPASGLDFLFNSFSATDFVFTGDATVESSVIRLTSKTGNFSMGRAFYPYPLPRNSRNLTTVSFSTSFVFSIVPELSNSPGFGLTFVLSNTTVPPGALAGQYFGLFNAGFDTPGARLLAVEFDSGQNPEFKDVDGNHIGIDLTGTESLVSRVAGYYNSTTGKFVPLNLRSGSNIQAWIDLDGNSFGINVTIAPLGIPKPHQPLVQYHNPIIASYVVGDLYVGFSASRSHWIETQRILAWTLATEGVLRDLNTSDLPLSFPEKPSKSSLSVRLIVGIVFVVVFTLLILSLGFYWFWIRKRKTHKDEEDEIQSWELDYWPHRFTYEELAQSTNGFSEDQLLGFGGFGRVYKGIDANNSMIAVKCINPGSKQGLKEFMAEISSIGRLQHKNLVRLKGWCKKGNEMLLVYDYMPNGNLYNWIFSKSVTLTWQGRLNVLTDVAEGLNYLHNEWDHLVLHRDIKSSNVLLDSDMRGRLGDFGLAKLCKHGQELSMTNLVGTIGYMAPELLRTAPTKASDIYSFGVVLLEVGCGRRPTELMSGSKELTLIDWIRMLQKEGKISEAADLRIAGEYNVKDMEMFLKLGLDCCDADPEIRPSMKEVLSELMSLKLPAASSSEKFSEEEACNFHYHTSKYSNQEESLQIPSIITEPGPRT